MREVRPGLWSDRLVVEFGDGWSTRTVREVRDSDVARTVLGHGELYWRRRRI